MQIPEDCGQDHLRYSICFYTDTVQFLLRRTQKVLRKYRDDRHGIYSDDTLVLHREAAF